ncbi:MAG: RNA-guided endonuclease TnpB family protein [Candidatus Poribacteria bacterium]|nr:RNA-guided endonuclease TnpB family protein [Candidatus Poribacteria bacterium]
MRNTTHKLFHDKSLNHLHNDLNIIGVVRNHFIALSMRYYRRYGKGLSYAKMSKHLTKLKRLAKYAHWHIPYSWSLQNMLKRLSESFREMRTLGRGHPQFKSCKKHKGMTFSGERVKIEKILDKQKNTRNHPTYKIRLNGRWYRFALHRRIQGAITQVHVTRDALEDVYITLTEDYSEVKIEPKTGKAEGFDMGIKDFLTTSDGHRYTSPMFYTQNADKLAEAQQAYSSKLKGSNNQERCRKDIARIHKKTANQRTDHHWKLAIDLCRDFDIMFFEDLNLEGMKRLWGKQISDLGFGEFMRKLKWQAKKRIRAVLKIGKWSPSTKCCCVCGHKNETLTLADRHWTCPSCHTHLDRDQNAAINILKEGVASFGLGVVSPIVLDNKIVGCSVEASSPLLHSTNAFA